MLRRGAGRQPLLRVARLREATGPRESGAATAIGHGGGGNRGSSARSGLRHISVSLGTPPGDGYATGRRGRAPVAEVVVGDAAGGAGGAARLTRRSQAEADVRYQSTVRRSPSSKLTTGL
jgi:hypothetical protein